MRTIIKIAFILNAAVVMGAAQQVTVPIVTYVPGASGRLHALSGIPGAATVGGALDVPFGISQTLVPPSHEYIVAVTGEMWPAVLHIKNGVVDTKSIQRSDSRIDRVALSPSGASAGFFSESEQRIYAFTSMASDSPIMLGQFDLRGMDQLTAFAISDSGQTVMAGVSNGAAGSLYIVTLDGAKHLIGSIGRASAMQFLWNSNAAVIADGSENKIYGYMDGQTFPIATEKDGISAPSSIAVSSDNGKAFVINSGSKSITRIGPYGTVAAAIHCDCVLTGLHPTSTDSVFRVTDFSGGPVTLFDGASRVPRMIFVPVVVQD
jgi:hypothetical protein